MGSATRVSAIGMTILVFMTVAHASPAHATGGGEAVGTPANFQVRVEPGSAPDSVRITVQVHPRVSWWFSSRGASLRVKDSGKRTGVSRVLKPEGSWWSGESYSFVAARGELDRIEFRYMVVPDFSAEDVTYVVQPIQTPESSHR